MASSEAEVKQILDSYEMTPDEFTELFKGYPGLPLRVMVDLTETDIINICPFQVRLRTTTFEQLPCSLSFIPSIAGVVNP